jgi:alkylation response protein AidB-like acyl-CoA dehydrogenase
MAKTYAGEMINRVTDTSLKIHGGNGYMMELFRAKVLAGCPAHVVWRLHDADHS